MRALRRLGEFSKLQRRAPPNQPQRRAQKEASEKRHRRNGVWLDRFIEAVSWCDVPPVRDADRRVVSDTADMDVVAAGAPAMRGAQSERLYAKLRKLLLGANEGYGYPSVGPQGMLKAVALLYPERCGEAFSAYLRRGMRRVPSTWCRSSMTPRRSWSCP